MKIIKKILSVITFIAVFALIVFLCYTYWNVAKWVFLGMGIFCAIVISVCIGLMFGGLVLIGETEPEQGF